MVRRILSRMSTPWDIFAQIGCSGDDTHHHALDGSMTQTRSATGDLCSQSSITCVHPVDFSRTEGIPALLDGFPTRLYCLNGRESAIAGERAKS
jgi:hypothetical protein